MLEDTSIEANWIDGTKKGFVLANYYVVQNDLGESSYGEFEYFYENYTLVNSSSVQEETTASNKYPHTCDYCGSPCWNGVEFDCSNSECVTKRK